LSHAAVCIARTRTPVPHVRELLANNEENLKAEFPSARRIVAVGDLHGSSATFLRLLR
jgi:hypothetical protein